jgi:hypothetical protein
VDTAFCSSPEKKIGRHVHVIFAEGEAKFWLEPEIEVAKKQSLL